MGNRMKNNSLNIMCSRCLRDTSGASVVIALVFFLICGIVGSVVMPAASVQAKAAQPHVDLQQN